VLNTVYGHYSISSGAGGLLGLPLYNTTALPHSNLKVSCK